MKIDLKRFKKYGTASPVIMLLVVAVVANSTVYKNRRARILYLILNRRLKVVCSKCGAFSTNLLLALSALKSLNETFFLLFYSDGEFS